MRLGTIIKNYRETNGISMDVFAERSGISKSYVGVIETGFRPKTGKPVYPSVKIIRKAAKGMNMDFNKLFRMIDEEISLSDDDDLELLEMAEANSIRIPVLGRVAAGKPIDAVEDILDYEEIPTELAERGDCFGLRIKGNSMEPRIYDGDTVIVLKQDTAESGSIVIASVSDDDAVCKKFIQYGKTTVLRSLNPSYDDIDVTDNRDFHIIGIVVEMRAKF